MRPSTVPTWWNGCPATGTSQKSLAFHSFSWPFPILNVREIYCDIPGEYFQSVMSSRCSHFSSKLLCIVGYFLTGRLRIAQHIQQVDLFAQPHLLPTVPATCLLYELRFLTKLLMLLEAERRRCHHEVRPNCLSSQSEMPVWFSGVRILGRFKS